MKSFYKITLMIAVVALMSACHSTEANYKESYDKAVAASRTGEKGEKYWQDIKVRSQNNYVVDGDSIRLVRNFFNIVDDDNSKIKPYNVVVAEFQQKFNAQSYRDRLRREEGLDAYVVYVSRTHNYCVVAQGYDNMSVAATFSRNPQKYMRLKPLVPKVYVLVR
ncbi:MAG: hypothetical protein SPL28_05945 [Bacteroidales bacterium]|nr:hypothetical protein [Bacteroidales bacterium]